MQWHPNCNYIATGSSDKTVRMWDVSSGECVRIFIGHRSMILSLAISPEGRYMASGDEDGTIMLWDLATGRCLTPLMGHTSCVWTLAFRYLKKYFTCWTTWRRFTVFFFICKSFPLLMRTEGKTCFQLHRLLLLLLEDEKSRKWDN